LLTCHALLKPFQVIHGGIEKNTNLILDISKMISRNVQEVDSWLLKQLQGDSLAAVGWLVG
jgi:hypothetical protein